MSRGSWWASPSRRPPSAWAGRVPNPDPPVPSQLHRPASLASRHQPRLPRRDLPPSRRPSRRRSRPRSPPRSRPRSRPRPHRSRRRRRPRLPGLRAPARRRSRRRSPARQPPRRWSRRPLRPRRHRISPGSSRSAGRRPMAVGPPSRCWSAWRSRRSVWPGSGGRGCANRCTAVGRGAAISTDPVRDVARARRRGSALPGLRGRLALGDLERDHGDGTRLRVEAHLERRPPASLRFELEG